MSKTYATRTFDSFSVEKDTIVLRDFTNNDLTIQNRRSLPKRAGDFPGMEKSEVKVTLVDPATGQTKAIATVSTSILVGTDPTKRDLVRDILVEIASSADYTNLIAGQRLISA